MIITVSNSSTGRQTNFDQWDCLFTDKNPAILVNKNRDLIGLNFVKNWMGCERQSARKKTVNEEK